MSTRKGQAVKLEDVLDEAISRARKIKDDAKIAEAVGIGAVKYFDLMHHPATDIIVDWEKMFVLEGNSAPYLQYTAARAKSVLRKAKLPITPPRRQAGNNQLPIKSQLNTEELGVLRSLVRYPEVIRMAAETFSPNLLCNYLFALAQKYNNFYNQHRILPEVSSIESQVSSFRLRLTSATGQVLQNGLHLLGIETPEKM
jgi:arginyl-tRNA synthetase